MKPSQLLYFLLILGGCASTKVGPLPAMPEPPDYTQVSHPEGLDLADLKALFFKKNVPTLESLDSCDADFKKLTALTQSKEEIQKGTEELVQLNPIHYHWCFYGKFILLEDFFKTQTYLEERQKAVLETFSFLAPVGKAFYIEFHDSRYLRWAIYRYRQLSDFVFYRKLEGGKNPYNIDSKDVATGSFSQFKESPTSSAEVLVKYGIVKERTPASESTTPESGTPSKPTPKTD